MTHATGTGRYERLIERYRGLDPLPTAVAYPCEETALAGALEAARLGLLMPLLVGPASTIADVARKAGLSLGDTRIVDVPASRAASRAPDSAVYSQG